MIEVIAIIQIEGKEPHEEALRVSSLSTAENEIKNMVLDFNNSLRPNEKPRKFIRLKQQAVQLLHDWNKRNLSSLSDRNGIYDLMECSNCGLHYKAYGLSRRLGGYCYPERVCRTCNKQFKSEENCKKHNEKYHNAKRNIDDIKQKK